MSGRLRTRSTWWKGFQMKTDVLPKKLNNSMSVIREALTRAIDFVNLHTWQPIETAPKTGLKAKINQHDPEFYEEIIIVRVTDGERQCDAYLDIRLDDDYVWFSTLDGEDYGGKPLGFQPTHWMPLPLLPKDV